MPWIPIKNYCLAVGLSDSTVRRKIKKGEIAVRREGGRYLLFCDKSPASPQAEQVSVEADQAGSPPLLTGQVRNEGGKNGGQENGGTSSFDSTRIEAIVSFSSKALNSYLILSDKLSLEKEQRIKEKQQRIEELKVRVQELEKSLRELVSRQKDQSKIAGWI